MPADGYRYARLVRRVTYASMGRDCATCFGAVTREQGVDQWSPPDWRDGARRYGDVRIVGRTGDEQRQRELSEDRPGGFFDTPRLVADPILQDVPFADLPTEPGALRDLLQAAVLDLRWAGRARDAIKSERDGINGSAPQTPQQARTLLVDGVISILGDAHITPRLRSALFGVLASIDGARALGRVSEPLGRSGEGVAFDDDTDDAYVDSPAFELRIVVDPDTSELLPVSSAQRDPTARPRLGPKLRDVTHTWITGTSTMYVRTANVAKLGERP